MKSTDGGKTFTEVFKSELTDKYYFNGIDCSSESHCVAVAEGYDSAGSTAVFAFVTFDGGNSWTNTLMVTATHCHSLPLTTTHSYSLLIGLAFTCKYVLITQYY